MHGFLSYLSIRLGLLPLLATLALTRAATPTLAEPTHGGTRRR
jgi:hypothetical protein